MKDFTRLGAKDVLDENSLGQHKKFMDFFHYELSKLNTNIYILKRIVEFPFDLFFAPQDTIFFSTVARNFFENSILTISKLVKDDERVSYTLCFGSTKFGQMRAFLKLQIMCNNLKLGGMYDNREKVQGFV